MKPHGSIETRTVFFISPVLMNEEQHKSSRLVLNLKQLVFLANTRSCWFSCLGKFFADEVFEQVVVHPSEPF